MREAPSSGLPADPDRPGEDPSRPASLARALAEGKTEALPDLAPRTVRALWALFLLVLVAAALAWRTPVPVYARGTAVVLAGGSSADVPLLVLMPARCAASWRSGDEALVHVGATTRSVTLSTAEPRAVGPQEVEERFALRGAAAAGLDGARAVGTAALPGGPDVPTDPGTVLAAEIEVGRRSALSLLLHRGDR